MMVGVARHHLRPMTLGGKKKWLWLLFITIAIAALPLILLALMICTRLLSMLAGPVNIWNTASRAPAIQDLIGVYELSEKSQEFLSSQLILWPKQSGFKLEANHKAAVFGVPAFDGGARHESREAPASFFLPP
jgi:hypothetical protein